MVVILTNETGQELYIKFCSSCHGDSVTGTPTFSGSIKGYTPIKDIVKNGKGKMSSIDLDDAPIAKIQDYLLSLKTDTKKLSGNDYYKAVCSGCHSSEGDGVANKGYQIKNPDIGFRIGLLEMVEHSMVLVLMIQCPLMVKIHYPIFNSMRL